MRHPVYRSTLLSVVPRINVAVTRIALGIGHVGISKRDAPAGAITITAIVLTSATTLRDDDGRRRYDRDNIEIRELVWPNRQMGYLARPFEHSEYFTNGEHELVCVC